MDIFICSGNKKKLAELTRICSALNINLQSPQALGLDIGNIPEPGVTFSENAEYKARAGLRLSGLPTIADDSGLCVAALSGRPGVCSARYGGGGLTDEQRTDLLLKELAEASAGGRSAYFECALCCVFPSGDVIRASGRLDGTIGLQKQGENGFGYDPVFLMDNNRSLAQLTGSEKDAISHRGRALRIFADKLQDYLILHPFCDKY